MKTVLLALLLIATCAFVSGEPKPKIKNKDNIVSVDGVPYFYFKYNRLVVGFDVAKTDGTTKLLFLRRQEYINPSAVSKSNPTGKSTFYSMVRDGESETLCELRYASAKYVAKLFLEYKILDENGNIIDANLKTMAGAIGKTYSSKYVIIMQ